MLNHDKGWAYSMSFQPISPRKDNSSDWVSIWSLSRASRFTSQQSTSREQLQATAVCDVCSYVIFCLSTREGNRSMWRRQKTIQCTCNNTLLSQEMKSNVCVQRS